MVDVKREHTFDAPIGKVWAMFHDPASHVSKFSAMDHRDLEVISEDLTDDALTMTISRLVDTDLPGFAKKVLKPTHTVVSVDTWRDNGDGTYGGEFSAETRGAPISIKGVTKVTAIDEQTTHYTVTTSINVKIPLIGGKVADFSKGVINKQMDDEFRLGDAWLSEH